MKKIRRYLVLALAVLSLTVTTACSRQGNNGGTKNGSESGSGAGSTGAGGLLETLGDDLSDAADKVGDDLSDAADNIRNGGAGNR